ncbi:MAG: putative cell division protein WhiA [Chloroflexi bacterium]|nr:putative cell division protein WhiA [Chloroflexota bacterium]
MTAADRDLVAALRIEVAAIYPPRACDRLAEQAGLADALAVRDPVIARLSVRMERSAHSAGEAAAAGAPGPFHFAESPEHCRMAYLRGRFLARGSLSLAGGRTHLEFVVDDHEAPVLAGWLTLAGLPASWRIRRGRGVVTWKGGETVGLFLRRIGANATLLELEARQVARALRGDLNRVLNAESANLERSVAAAGRQLAAIDQLEADGRLAEQSRVVRVVAEARRATPEATLTELSDRLAVHRSTVQRALDRMERIARHAEGSPAPLA